MLTFAQIAPYLKFRNPAQVPADLRHKFYSETIQYKDKLKMIFGDEYPKYMDVVRPSEAPSNKNYRKSIYKNQWEDLPDRIAEALDYIHQADDFGITFPKLDGVKPEDSLEVYTGESLTPDGSLKDWFFNNVLEPYLLDPNAVFACVITEPPTTDARFKSKGLFEPKPVLFPSENVIMHQKGRFAVLYSPEKRVYFNEQGQRVQGTMVYFFDDESFTVAFEEGITKDDSQQENINWIILGVGQESFINETGDREQRQVFKPMLHGCDTMPLQKIGKRRKKFNDLREELYKSTLDGAISKIKESQQIQNDLELERTLHVVSEKWRRKSSVPACPNVKCVGGVETVYDENGTIKDVHKCPTCKGTGNNPTSGSALEIVIVNDEVDPMGLGANEAAKPATNGAPGGYIERSIQPMIELAKEHIRISNDVYQVLNMQFINNIPTVASGVSKSKDREELYKNLNTQAAHLIPLLKRGYEITDKTRYMNNPKVVGMQTPEIMVPVRFNLENAELTREELNDAKDKEYDPALVQVLEDKLLDYNVGKNSAEYKQYETRIRLDPFRTANSDEKNMLLTMTMLTLEDGDGKENAIREFYFSIFLDALMIRAQNEHEEKGADFYALDINQRSAYLRGLLPEYYTKSRNIQMPIDPKTGMPTVAQTAVKPAVNVQDTNQTSKKNKQTRFGAGK